MGDNRALRIVHIQVMPSRVTLTFFPSANDRDA
jgi:hypothetical protein